MILGFKLHGIGDPPGPVWWFPKCVTLSEGCMFKSCQALQAASSEKTSQEGWWLLLALVQHGIFWHCLLIKGELSDINSWLCGVMLVHVTQGQRFALCHVRVSLLFFLILQYWGEKKTVGPDISQTVIGQILAPHAQHNQRTFSYRAILLFSICSELVWYLAVSPWCL